MTTTSTTARTTSRTAGRREPPVAADASGELAVAARQLRAIDVFNRSLHLAEQVAAASARTRETRMDSTRRMEVLRRQHQAVVDRAHEQLLASGDLLGGRGAGRVVLAHRQEWFVDRVSAALTDRGLDVVARLDNGADAIGLTLCEQPDLVLVEDALAMVPGVEVVRELRVLCPETRIVAQCGSADRVGALLEAGAAAVYTRQVPPVEVASGMAALVA